MRRGFYMLGAWLVTAILDVLCAVRGFISYTMCCSVCQYAYFTGHGHDVDVSYLT
jgi:hypothetical protein